MSAQPSQAAGTTQAPATLMDAWRSFNVFDHHANLAKRRFSALRETILALSVLTITLPLVPNLIPQGLALPSWFNSTLHYLIILAPITVSLLTAISAQFRMGEKWVLLRDGAETLKKEIYRFRSRSEIYSDEKTKTESREVKLARKIKLITGRLMKTMANRANLTLGEKVCLCPPTNILSKGDDGVSDLKTGGEYLSYRLEDQLGWYRSKIRWHHSVQRRNLILIMVFGAMGTFLAAINLDFWIPVVIAISASLTTYLEIMRIEPTLVAYNQSAADLENIRVWWNALSDEQKQDAGKFDGLVTYTEMAIGNEHIGWVQEMSDILTDLYGEGQTKGETSES